MEQGAVAPVVAVVEAAARKERRRRDLQAMPPLSLFTLRV